MRIAQIPWKRPAWLDAGASARSLSRTPLAESACTQRCVIGSAVDRRRVVWWEKRVASRHGGQGLLC